MKKYFLILAAALISASCSTVLSTATYENADASFRPTISVADVEVSGTKISYTYIPTKQVRKGGSNGDLWGFGREDKSILYNESKNIRIIFVFTSKHYYNIL